ncbi:DNA polymerase [Demetria terragena]|uniref:DNA polymerase n=1 Tax=Demetria terragena TaxID=63959 RepID=UPI000361795B|nr:DNA polymerase [Demetria terragena]
MRGSLLVAVVRVPGSPSLALYRDRGLVAEGRPEEIASTVAKLQDTSAIRVCWWNRSVATELVRAGLRISRCWDVQEAHRLLCGGWSAAPDEVWANAVALPMSERPAPLAGDLFDEPAQVGGPLVRPDGYLDPRVLGDERPSADDLAEWAELLFQVVARQAEQLQARSPTAVSTALSESGTSVLITELERDGVPIERARLTELITQAAGVPPESERHAAQLRADRDDVVRRLVPGRERTDLRNPAQVLELLHAVGVKVEDTRAWRLEAHRHTHPVVEALLGWRKAERIATTYGWGWLQAHVGPDDRLRGPWTTCDGGAGRMTAGAGLHSLPAPLRPGVAAPAGTVLVRADLGQVEPRVLAVVSRDEEFARATHEDDLYAVVAAQLGVERSIAKIAVLSAMYGQTTGPAAAALERMKRTYPTAMAYLDAAAAQGQRGEAVQTYGGRHIPVTQSATAEQARAVGRFTRNAVVQGAAAELFKAWALTVRHALWQQGDGTGRIVLMLHDELLIEVPQNQADDTVTLVHHTLTDAARRWSGGAPVRFVADVAIIHRWSEAKG